MGLVRVVCGLCGLFAGLRMGISLASYGLSGFRMGFLLAAYGLCVGFLWAYSGLLVGFLRDS